MKTIILSLLILSCTICNAGEYNAYVTHVYDGDTITCMVALGLGVQIEQKIRLAGLNTPELPTKEGIAARDWLTSKILHAQIILVTDNDKREKYGRLLGTIIFNKENINELMIKQKIALPYDGGAR